MRFFALPVAILASLVLGANSKCNGPNAVTKPPAGAIVVDGSRKRSGTFPTISQAVAHLSDTANKQTIFVYPGVYHEQVLIEDLNGPLILQGFTCDAMSYAANQVMITQAKAQKDISDSTIGSRDDLTSTLRIKTDNVRVYNLNVENSAGKISQNGQALALNVKGDKCSFYACNFIGYQDTVYSSEGHHLFALSCISGAVDFIFGARSKVWFDSCDIPIVGPGAITANGRNSESNPSIFVFNRAYVYSASTDRTSTGKTHLGRPWRKFSRVVFQHSDLSDVINPAGWEKWSDDDDTSHVYYKEYKNTGAGAATRKRVSFSGQLKTPVPITDVLGKSYAKEWYVDTKYLSSDAMSKQEEAT